MNIGVFDSGLGGLTIFKELIKNLPQYNYMYLGDNARVPYGGRSQEIIYEFTRQAVEFLFKKNCALIVLACNTSSAAALRRIQQEYLPNHYSDRRVLGVIKPVVEAVTESNAKRVGIIATRATVNAKSFIKEIHKLNSNIAVIQQAGPLLVPFIEEGETDSPAFISVLKRYLEPLVKKDIDSLILACTHYELVKDEVKNIVGKKINVIAEGKIVAQKLIDYLRRHPEIERQLDKQSNRIYYITDVNARYKYLSKVFLDGYFSKRDKLKRVQL